jgi:hypothetical protein
MNKQIRDITIFIGLITNTTTGREYVDNASIQIRDKDLNLVAQVGLHSVVNTEKELWDNVELTVQRMIDEGHQVDNPEVHIWRSHETRTEIDYHQAIGRHL